MHVTDRDLDILRYVNSFKLLGSRSHIVPLFGGGSDYVLRRCQAMCEEKYLHPLKTAPHEENIYGIGDRGADLLKERFGTYRPKVHYPSKHDSLSKAHIRHTLGIADVTIGYELACRGRADFEDLGTQQWTAEVAYDGYYAEKGIEPDRIFRIGEDYFALEYDRGTMRVKGKMNQSSIFRKMLQYWWLWAEHELPEYPNMRTLFVLPGKKRKATCIKANTYFYDGRGTGLFLFVTRDELLGAEDLLNAPVVSGVQQPKLLLPA